MQYGVCASADSAAALAKAGFDFIEVNVQGDLAPQKDEAAFAPLLDRLRACAAPCRAANCFVPGALKITGPAVDMPRLLAYAATAFARARRAGIETIVFGSGGARAIPEGFDRAAAYAQLVEFGRGVGPLAAERGVTVAVEPLNRAECNVFTSVAECAAYVRDVNHPAVRLLVDGYHWARDNDSAEAVVEAGGLLRHVHIATYAGRFAPGLEACDFSLFLRSLLRGGYEGRISIEGRWNDLAAEAPQALRTLREAVEAARREG
jgi:sugar phosphate isomerase/epimerase